MVRLPVRVPDAVDRTVTLTVHEAPAAMEPPQVLVCAKSPVMPTLDTVAAVELVLVSVTVCPPLLLFSAWLANVNELGAAVSVDSGVPVPPLGKTSKSDNWPAGQPLFAVMFTRTHHAVVALKVMVTVLLLAFGSNV